jgi:hypothetical protein
VLGAASAAVVAVAQGAPWTWWQWSLMAVLAVDVVGGVAANGLASTTAFYHRRDGDLTGFGALLRHEAGFAAAHVHPFVVVALFPGGTWRWAAVTYVLCVVGSAVVRGSPLTLRRPVALAAGGLAIVSTGELTAPVALAWFAPVLVLKLVVAHAGAQDHAMSTVEDVVVAAQTVAPLSGTGSRCRLDLCQWCQAPASRPRSSRG